MRRRLDLRRSRGGFALSLALAMVVLAGCGQSAGSRATPTATPATATGTVMRRPTEVPIPCNLATQWKAPTDNVGLNDFAMVSPTEGWAVGSLTAHWPPTTPSDAPAGVLYHLTGDTWQRLPQTYPGAELSTLSMGSPDDGWAASTSAMTGMGTQALVLHYHEGHWTPVDVPALDAVLKGPPGSSGGSIQGISVQMFGPDAGWLFAWTNIPRDPNNPTSRAQVVILRYTHGAWTPIAAPTVSLTTELFSLSAVSANEAWIVGTDYGNDLTTLFAHYVNGAWSMWPQTFPGVTEQFTMLSPTEGWAFDTGGGDDALLHFDGTTWASVAGPGGGDPGIAFTSAVFPVAPGVSWLVAVDASGIDLEQYANGQWQQVAWPSGDVVPERLVAGKADEVLGHRGHLPSGGLRPGTGHLGRARRLPARGAWDMEPRRAEVGIAHPEAERPAMVSVRILASPLCIVLDTARQCLPRETA